MEWTNRLSDYAVFHRESTATGDYDPVYPVLAGVARRAGWNHEQTLWACLAHVAYYDLGSALRLVATYPRPVVPGAELLALPCGTERRAHRDPAQLRRHLAALVDAANTWGGLVGWLRAGMEKAPPGGLYPTVNQWVREVYGNGRWAAYKTCELLAYVLGMPGVVGQLDGRVWPAVAELAPTDMGHAHSSGPRRGLELVAAAGLPSGNRLADVARLDAVSGQLCDQLRQRGLWAPVSVVETTLCDYHSLVEGRYYVGHDVDQMLGQLLRTRSALTDVALAARAAALPAAYLGECQPAGRGWAGVDKPRSDVYRRTGRIVLRAPDGDVAAVEHPLDAP